MFTVPESKRSHHQNQFEFTLPGDDRTHRLPKMKYLPVGAIEKLSGLGQQVSIADLLSLFDKTDPATTAAVRELDSEQLEALTVAWQKDSGVTVGESSASTDS